VKREIAVAVLAIALLLPFPAQSNPVERTGFAYRLGQGDLLYVEEHEDWIVNGQVRRSTVTYRDAGGRIIARKSLDFSENLASPGFHLSNLVNGHEEGARREEDRLLVFFRKSDEHAYREARLQPPEEAIIDGGFDRFIEANWEQLLSGRVFERPFLVPSFQKFVEFQNLPGVAHPFRGRVRDGAGLAAAAVHR
jgi:hypothetical protein